MNTDTGWRHLFKTYVGTRSEVSYWLCRADFTLKTIIWKDPLAVFAAEAAVTRHRIPVVATVRPAIAVAASFKRMGWTPPVADLEKRLREVGPGDEAVIRRYRDRLDQSPIAAAILWRLAYRALVALTKQTPAVHLVNVQDLVEKPIDRYRHLYERLGLPWSPRVAATIRRRHRPFSGKRDAPMPQRAHVAKRNLRAINEYGRKLLTADEAVVIEEITATLWREVQSACLTWPDEAATPLDRHTAALTSAGRLARDISAQ